MQRLNERPVSIAQGFTLVDEWEWKGATLLPAISQCIIEFQRSKAAADLGILVWSIEIPVI